MVNWDEKIEADDDVFFDALNDQQFDRDEFWGSKSDFEIKSVRDRRDLFFREMGFSVKLGEKTRVSFDDSSEEISSGNVSISISSSCSSIDDLLPSSSEERSSRNVSISSSCSSSCSSSIDDSLPSSSSSSRTEDGEGECSKGFGRQWWKKIAIKTKKKKKKNKEDGDDRDEKKRRKRVEIRVRNKRFQELSGVFSSQEIEAHTGVIRAMKFSPDGQYLATGGQDGVVKIWRVTSTSMDTSLEESIENGDEFTKPKKVKKAIVLPDKMFKLEEQPLHEFCGHFGDVLDLAWSRSNCLVSASMNRTVRLWKVGFEECLGIFHHTNYVTCVQFNPMDDHTFITGSVDRKVRIWGVSNGRVLDWVDVGDSVTAVCYQPDGQGFLAGSLGGTCRIYEQRGGELLEHVADIVLHKNRRSSTTTNRITGIQFSPKDSEKVMVSCEDSKLRIFDKMDIVSKYRGPLKSGSRMCASYTLNGRHIISVGEDSRVYIWNHAEDRIPSPIARPTKSVHSFEHFFVKGVSVAVPWSSTSTQISTNGGFSMSGNEHGAASQASRSSLGFFLNNLLSSKRSATWPEDMLPGVVVKPLQEDSQEAKDQAILPPSWGLVVVTGSCDGRIQTFQNYGLPVGV